MHLDGSILLLDVVPLLIFVVVDSLSNMRYAIAGALIAAALELGYSLYRFGAVDEFSVASVGLILLFGGLSIKFDDPLYFKFKPVVLSGIMALVFLVAYALSKPLLLLAADRYREIFPEPMQTLLDQPRIRQIFARASLYMGFGCIVHAAVVAWAALRLGNWGWLVTRTGGAYLITFLVLFLATL